MAGRGRQQSPTTHSRLAILLVGGLMLGTSLNGGVSTHDAPLALGAKPGIVSGSNLAPSSVIS